MMVDIAPQQQLTEIFTSNHSHHRSSSSSSSTHRRNSNSNSSSSSQSTISNGHRLMSEDLGRKAEQILGHARNAFGYSRQTSLDFTGQNPIRLNISQTKAIPPSRNPNSVSQPAKSTTSETSSTKTRRSVTVEELLPLIFQLVAAPKFDKLPERISRCQPDREPIDTVMKSREMTDSFHRTTDLQLSDDENEDEDDDDDEDLPSNKISQSVLTETSEQNNMKNKSHHQTNSNENRSSAHPYENQIETEHSGQSSSRCEEDDSEDDDSDNQEAAHSDAENEDQNNPSNPSTLSLMYFIPQNEPMYEPVQSSFKQSPESNPIGKKRSISPDPERDEDNHVHNCEDHQNKRQKLLIKRALLKSFVSSVNTKIDMKRPSLPICIPTSLLLDQCSTDSTSSKSNGQTNESDIAIDRSQRASKRQLNGFVKKEKSNNTDITAQTSQSNSSNNSINETYPKKTKTPPSNDKTFSTQSTTVKNESTIVPPSSNDGEDRNRSNKSPRSTVPEKKEKTLIKSVPQSTPTENLSMSNESRKLISMKLKNLSKADLTTLGRKKKKEADNIKSLTVSGAREAMSLYLESVCYFIQCANEESKIDQRIGLLSTTLTMLQQLVSNYQKLFCVNASQPSDALQSIRQKFLLINYWLQSLIYHLQFNTNMPTIERAAGQVTEYFNQLKNPSSSSNKTSQPQQSTPNNDSNPISPLSVNSQTSASDSSTNQSQEQHRSLHDFSKLMLSSYYSTYYWNKAERLMREKPLKDFTEQLLKQNQNRHLSRDDPPLEFLLYMFDAIELLRVSVA